MKIAVDARALFREEITGIGTYVLHLVQYLQSTDVELYLFTDQPDCPSNVLPAGKSNVLCAPAKNRYLWEQVSLPRLLARTRPDLFHATWNYGIPFRCQTKTVLTVHDVIPLILKELYRPKNVRESLRDWLYRMSLRHSLKVARKVITVSQSSYDDLSGLFPASKHKTIILHEGCDSPPPPMSHAEWETLRQKFRLAKPYFVYFGGFEVRKNIAMLMEAFLKLRKGHDIQLLLIGKKNAYYDGHLSRYAREPSIVFTDYVSGSELAQLVGKSLASVYPSLYEGFGLPVLEAMSFGTPVITSDVSSMREVGGDCAYYFDPTNENSLTHAMEDVICNPWLVARLRECGLARYRQFKWSGMTHATYDLYLSLVQ